MRQRFRGSLRVIPEVGPPAGADDLAQVEDQAEVAGDSGARVEQVVRVTRAVDGLSFDVVPGRVTGFLGPNGAGSRRRCG